MKNQIFHFKKLLTASILMFCMQGLFASTGTWNSPTTGGSISYKVTESPNPVLDASNACLTVVYLENPGFRKVGAHTNAENVAWLLAQGYRVIELDYAKHANAVSPAINADIIAINDAVFAGSFCGLTNCSKYRTWILFEGYRIARDVSYFKDDPTVYNYPATYTEGDSLKMDIIYPAGATDAVPVVLSFSYSNSSFGSANRNQRLNLGNTLAGFDDSILEGAPARGMAWAIADHPKYCPWGNGKPTGGANDTYKSYQVNPDAAQKLKSAVRTLRKFGETAGLSTKIGIYGFSRGSDAGSMAIGDRQVALFENAGLHTGVSSAVQAAALGPGVFDFTQIYNFSNDGDSNLETRCPWAWGPLAENYALWESMGSAWLAQTSATAPVLFFYNNDDAGYYRDQVTQFKSKLTNLGVPVTTLLNYGTGHAVPKTASSIKTVYDFYEQYLTPPSIVDSTTGVLSPDAGNESTLNLSVSRAGNNLQLQFSLTEPAIVHFTLCDLNGKSLYKNSTPALHTGIYQFMIPLAHLQTDTQTVLVNVYAGQNLQTLKLLISNVTNVVNIH